MPTISQQTKAHAIREIEQRLAELERIRQRVESDFHFHHNGDGKSAAAIKGEKIVH